MFALLRCARINSHQAAKQNSVIFYDKVDEESNQQDLRIKQQATATASFDLTGLPLRMQRRRFLGRCDI